MYELWDTLLKLIGEEISEFIISLQPKIFIQVFFLALSVLAGYLSKRIVLEPSEVQDKLAKRSFWISVAFALLNAVFNWGLKIDIIGGLIELLYKYYIIVIIAIVVVACLPPLQALCERNNQDSIKDKKYILGNWGFNLVGAASAIFMFILLKNEIKN